MHHFGFASEQKQCPRAADPARAETGRQRWIEALEALTGEAAADDPAARGRALADDPAARALLDALFGNSDYLTLVAVKEPVFALDLFGRGPDACLDDVMAGLVDLKRDGTAAGDQGLGRALRRAKRRASLAIALADITGTWDVARVTAALSDLAEAALGCACAQALRQLAARGAIALPDDGDPEAGSGLIVLGMGKFGGRELNYSSDIDIIVLYDDEVVRSDAPDGLQNHFVRLARNLVKVMDERTADGYVFRMDLRLRPDPGATPLALSALAAELYYESLGQNWERAAMIKARPVAGDRAAAAQFLERLRPFIWRKNLDFAAIQDIHSIKRQINAHKGGGAIAVNGHNVKLGRGGIREIEFFAQTQQLIWGGRVPEVRRRRTVDGLAALTALGQVSAATTAEMTEAYEFLRRVEHRLQMINDEQTQTLPRDPAALNRLAVFLGFAGRDAFAAALLARLRTVESHYAELFEDAPSLGGREHAEGNLVFTGSEPDPETLKTLEALGFANPRAVDGAIRGWHHGRYRAVRSARAREILTELVPVLLAAFGRVAHPDAAFIKFDEFLSRVPTGVQLFSMIHAKPELLDLLADLMGSAPKLADHLANRPAVLDSVLTGDFFDPPPSPEFLDEEIDRQLAQARDEEDMLDISRRWANDRRFQVGIQVLSGKIEPRPAAEALSNVAETAIRRLLPRIIDAFAAPHGRILKSGMAVIAMGKLGAREMTRASDLDLIFVYDVPPGTEMSSGGRKPLAASQYFARLSQRLINAITAQTSEGSLYEVDMRLRPSGNAGPIACSFETFAKYQAEDAWTWEHMALTRGRVITGPIELADAVEDEIRKVLTRRRDPEALLMDVADMRRRMDKEHHTDDIWSVKHLRGGLVDLEFMAQYLQLRHAHDHPEVLDTNTHRALGRIRDAGLLEPAVANDLIAALDLWQALQGMLRLTLEGVGTPHDSDDPDQAIPAALKPKLAQLTGVPDFNSLVALMRETAERTYGHFRTLIEDPATALWAVRGDAQGAA
ncbi:MAG: bifunctional [glutamine synthetase] adenylyltransferase/[glutamine synthetase]-adenylyl-L-tyrosine phosphorylase [Hyphomicrobiales bacterium]|nr:bifunctional [glutamine synthetase] adenylyltransferase/[glutamine synthetase]-adenylyl-L-tyrosine phosphorylase [Hyphomicrobiales bacterium]